MYDEVEPWVVPIKPGITHVLLSILPLQLGGSVVCLRHHLFSMSFKDFSNQSKGVKLLQRSLAKGRLGHAYLFLGDTLEELESLARTLAKTLNCNDPKHGPDGEQDCCDECVNCRKIDDLNHGDVLIVRPESKSRVIKTEQIARRSDSPSRVVVEFANLKPTEGAYKVCILVAADRLQTNAANAFLKTLEEPPLKTVFILLSTEPSRILETILSRCLRLSFSNGEGQNLTSEQLYWLQQFSSAAALDEKSLFGRYRLLDALLSRLGAVREKVEETLTAQSPLEKYVDAEKGLREKWEDELKAAIESEYRRQRAEDILLLEWWLRDVWLFTLPDSERWLKLPQVAGAEEVARRISAHQAQQNIAIMEHTQRLLHSNVQEALALEVGLLKLQM